MYCPGRKLITQKQHRNHAQTVCAAALVLLSQNLWPQIRGLDHLLRCLLVLRSESPCGIYVQDRARLHGNRILICHIRTALDCEELCEFQERTRGLASTSRWEDFIFFFKRKLRLKASCGYRLFLGNMNVTQSPIVSHICIYLPLSPPSTHTQTQGLLTFRRKVLCHMGLNKDGESQYAEFMLAHLVMISPN